MQHPNKYLLLSLTIVVMFSLIYCERNDRFYRPNLPEKLCTIGIIDADDTARYISFEKSFQIEYPEEVNDSLRDFTFIISSSTQEIFKYKSDTAIKSLLDLKIPNDLDFSSEQYYYLHASEKSTQDISAEISIPQPPSDLVLNSINREIHTLPEPNDCRGLKTNKFAILDISFNNDSKQKNYYAILLKGTGYSMNSSMPPPVISYLDFSIRNSNTPGFFAMMHGLKMFHWSCVDYRLHLEKSEVNAYFIEGIKIPDQQCDVIISIQYHDTYSTIDYLRFIDVKLLSIPEELFLFEKSLYTYNQVRTDPFSEPVYLNGNIKSGNGVFAVCRSKDLKIDLPLPPIN